MLHVNVSVGTDDLSLFWLVLAQHSSCISPRQGIISKYADSSSAIGTLWKKNEEQHSAEEMSTDRKKLARSILGKSLTSKYLDRQPPDVSI